MRTLFIKRCPMCKVDRPVVQMGTRPAHCINCHYPYDENTWNTS